MGMARAPVSVGTMQGKYELGDTRSLGMYACLYVSMSVICAQITPKP